VTTSELSDQPTAAAPEFCLDENSTAYLEHLRSERQYSSHTLKAYRDDLIELHSGLGALEVELLGAQEADLRRLLTQATRQKLSPRTLARRLSCWRGYFDWLARQQQVTSNPARAIKAPKAPKRLPKALAPDEAMSLANHLPESQFEAMRDKAMIELLYSCGLRVSELQALDWRYVEFAATSATPKYKSQSWLDFEQAQVTVLGKGQKSRIVPVGSAAVNALQRWLAFRRDAEANHPNPGRRRQYEQDEPKHRFALFTSLAGQRLSVRSLQARTARLGLKQGLSSRLHPHVLRHSFASHVLQSSGDLRAVQEMLGHENITSTQIYTSLDFQRLAAVYDAAHPRAKKL
jgi:integrase/recombinase XerC